MWPPKPGKKADLEEKANPLIGKYDDFYANAKVYDQKFGLVLTADNLKNPAKMSLSYGPDNFYPWRPFAAPDRLKKHDKEKEELMANNFAIHIDVQHFKPNEINIKVLGRQCSVKASHGDREDDHGYVARKFEREFMLPTDIDVESVKSVISSDGVLTFRAARTAPRKIKRNHVLMGAMTYSNEDTSQNTESVNSASENASSDDEVGGIEIPIHFVKEEENKTGTSRSEHK
ncbi:hypothetical protein V9T40_005877 [Parthenolecanium corni]|uniref:SHSP domain-containing protein n=1 Tax=Parthenolecanium corni TaxID=536013 RepID=A0AAN9TUY9_9HEMI